VETWPKTVEGLLYLRDFIVRDKEQNIIARATSGWLAIDADNKRPKLLDAIQSEVFVHLRNKHALNELPERLSSTDTGEIFKVHSAYFDFDLNRHVTSTRYIDWMMDTFNVGFHKTNFPKKLSINFMKETLPGDSITIVRQNQETSNFSFEGTNLSHSTVAFRGKIEF
jgi:medium-chain acyl-[acyl-carrier-protein] hydrolase